MISVDPACCALCTNVLSIRNTCTILFYYFWQIYYIRNKNINMAAYINRAMVQSSMIGGDSQLRSDVRNDNSPLQIFVKAKKRINDIFVDIEKYVEETVEFMTCK